MGGLIQVGNKIRKFGYALISTMTAWIYACLAIHPYL
jgi:hypothetical protein